MKSALAVPRPWRQVLWFAGIWAASVTVTLAAAAALRWWFDRLLSGHLL